MTSYASGHDGPICTNHVGISLGGASRASAVTDDAAGSCGGDDLRRRGGDKLRSGVKRRTCRRAGDRLHRGVLERDGRRDMRLEGLRWRGGGDPVRDELVEALEGDRRPVRVCACGAGAGALTGGAPSSFMSKGLWATLMDWSFVVGAVVFISVGGLCGRDAIAVEQLGRRRWADERVGSAEGPHCEDREVRRERQWGLRLVVNTRVTDIIILRCRSLGMLIVVGDPLPSHPQQRGGCCTEIVVVARTRDELDLLLVDLVGLGALVDVLFCLHLSKSKKRPFWLCVLITSCWCAFVAIIRRRVGGQRLDDVLDPRVELDLGSVPEQAVGVALPRP